MVAIDLDGTLLNSQNEISPGNVEAILQAQERGIEVVIATGRAQFDVMEILKKAGLSTWVIGANGATIHDPNGTLFSSVPIREQDATMILEWLEEHEYYYEVFTDEAILTPYNARELVYVELDRLKSANPETDTAELEEAIQKQWSQFGFQKVKGYKEIIDYHTTIYNVLAFSFDHDKLRQGWEKFENTPELTLVSSAKHNFELEHRDASKGLALQKLTRYLGHSLEQTAVFGDSPNDLSMFKVAGYRVAMDNAVEIIKEHSDTVTKTNDEDGIAYVLSTFS